MATSPSLFISHGAGPYPILHDDQADYRDLVRSLGSELDGVKAIILFTAHWETDQPHISASADPGLFYDYPHISEQMPKAAFEFDYPVKGDAGLAADIAKELLKVGFNPVLDTSRGFDHGVYVPMKLLRPKADIPIVQMSILTGANDADVAERNFMLGQAVATFRDRGCAVLGSGGSYHNFEAVGRAIFQKESVSESAQLFEEFLLSAGTISDGEERNRALMEWRQAAGSYEAHPPGKVEHLMPFMVAAGGGGDKAGKRIAFHTYLGIPLSFYRW